MSRNFSDFEFVKIPKEKVETKKESVKEEDLRKAYDEFSLLDENGLQEKLVKEISKRKQEGTLDVNMLLNSVESIKGFLPYETYMNLKQMIENMK